MLSLPSFSFSFEVDNLTGIPAVPHGTAFVAGSTNTDGAAVTALSALAQDCNYLVVGFSNTFTSGQNVQVLADILVDPAGGVAWTSLIDNLVCGMQAGQSATVAPSLYYHFPIWIKSGTSIGVRAQSRSSIATSTSRCFIYVFGKPSRPEMWWCGQKVQSLGISTATSQGTNVTPTTSGTYSAWTTIGTADYKYGAVQFGVNGSDATAAANNYFWQIGVSSEKLPGSPTIYRGMGTTEFGAGPGFSAPIWCTQSSGKVWQLRATASSIAAETFNAAIYGVY